MKTILTYSAALVALVLLAAGGSRAAERSASPYRLVYMRTTVKPSGTDAAHKIVGLRRSIAKHRFRTQHYRDLAGVSRYPAGHAERKTHSVAFLWWLDREWMKRQIRAKRLLASRRLPYTRDWLTAVRLVQRDWPGSAAWMLSCSAHEGGHGGFVMNSQGSGAGGWLQYMESTFVSHYSHAFTLARQRHLPVPPPGTGWTSPLGQAFAGGWGYSYNRSAWAGDPYC